MTVEFSRAWGFEDEGLLQGFTDVTKPKRTKNGFNSAWLAMGYKPVKVVITRERDLNKLLRMARSSRKPHSDPK